MLTVIVVGRSVAHRNLERVTHARQTDTDRKKPIKIHEKEQTDFGLSFSVNFVHQFYSDCM